MFIISIDDYILTVKNFSDREKEALKFSVMNISEEILQSTFIGIVAYGDSDYLIGLVGINNTQGLHLKELYVKYYYWKFP